MNRLFRTAVIALCAVAMPAYSLESTASGNGPQSELTSVQMQIESLKMLINDTINKILVCNNKKMIYAPNAPQDEKDGDGCVEAIANIEPTKYEIVKGKETVELPQSCVGSGSNGGCSLSVSLANYVGKENLMLTASCRGAAWCGGPSMGTVALPDLSNSFSAMTIVRHSGDKANGVNASWDASSKILSLSSFYTGKSTDRKRGAIDDLRLDYTTMELKEKTTE